MDNIHYSIFLFCRVYKLLSKRLLLSKNFKQIVLQKMNIMQINNIMSYICCLILMKSSFKDFLNIRILKFKINYINNFFLNELVEQGKNKKIWLHSPVSTMRWS